MRRASLGPFIIRRRDVAVIVGAALCLAAEAWGAPVTASPRLAGDLGAPAPVLAAADAPLFVPPASRTGPVVIARRQRPEGELTRACSFRRRVCVHLGSDVDESAALEALVAAERTLDAYAALGLPAPLGDDGRGGDDALDVYLTAGAHEPVVTRDPPKLGESFDTSSAFIEIAPPPARRGCYFDSALAQATARVILARVDAGAGDGEAAIEASYLASVVAPCGVREIEGIDLTQRSPERAITAPARGYDGHAGFAASLDERYASSAPGGVMMTLLQLAGQRTQPGAWRFDNEPDLFDALRVNAGDPASTVGAQLLDYAVARGLYGRPTARSWEPAGVPALGQARLEWSVPYSSLPRRLAPLRPIDSTGAAYLWVDLAGAPADAKLVFIADWELPVLFRWSLVKVGAGGELAGRLDVAALFGRTHAEQTLMNVGGLAGVLVVGVNDGDIARDVPFDPDEAPHEPHGFAVTLYP